MLQFTLVNESLDSSSRIPMEWAQARRIIEKTETHGGLILVCMCLVIAAVCGLILLAGIPPTSAALWDVLALLDGGWRIHTGQRVFHDFTTTVGAMEEFRMAAAIRLGGGSTIGIAYLNAILAAVVMLWSYLLLQPRMNRVVCLLTSLTLGLLVASPTPLGELVTQFSRAMEYNRLGYTSLGLIVLEMFLNPPEDLRWNQIAGAISSGFILGTMPLQKPTYFFMGLSYVALAILLGRLRGRRLMVMGASFLLTATALLLWTSPGLGLILGFSGLIGSRSAAPRLDVVRIVGKIVLYQSDFWALAIAGYLSGASGASANAERWRNAALGGFTYFAGIGLLTTNAQNFGTPLTGVVLLIFVSLAIQGVLRAQDSRRMGELLATALLAAAYWLGPTMKDGMSLTLGALEHVQHPRPQPGSLVAGLPGRELAFKDAPSFVAFINDGTALLSSTSPQECVVSLMYANMYSYLIGRNPCHGGRSFIIPEVWGDLSKVPSETLIGDSPDLILVPKEGTVGWREGGQLLKKFAPMLAEQYDRTGDTAYWSLYRRKR